MTSRTKPHVQIAESELVAFEHGAAGHEGISTSADGSLIIKPCVQAEIDFYESASQHPEFQAHMPVFMGSLALHDDQTAHVAGSAPEQGVSGVASGAAEQMIANVKPAGEVTQVQDQDGKKSEWVSTGGKKITTSMAIVLDNAAAGFKRPNIIDLKLGSRLWDDRAPEAKRKKLDEVAAETTSGSMGFRVAGMKVWLCGQAESEKVEVNTEIKAGYKSFDKFYGRTLDERNVDDAFVRFLNGRSDGPRFSRRRARLLLERLTREIENIEYVLEHVESRMYSASILIVAEGDDEALDKALDEAKKRQEEDVQDQEQNEGEDDDDDDDNPGPKILEVRLIDFAHAAWTPGQGPDENALRGVRSILKILRELAESN